MEDDPSRCNPNYRDNREPSSIMTDFGKPEGKLHLLYFQINVVINFYFLF